MRDIARSFAFRKNEILNKFITVYTSTWTLWKELIFRIFISCKQPKKIDCKTNTEEQLNKVVRSWNRISCCASELTVWRYANPLRPKLKAPHCHQVLTLIMTLSRLHLYPRSHYHCFVNNSVILNPITIFLGSPPTTSNSHNSWCKTKMAAWRTRIESGASKHRTLCAVLVITFRKQTVGSDQTNVTNIQYSQPTLLREQYRTRRHTHLQQKNRRMC